MAKGWLRWIGEGYGERGAVDFMCSPGVAGRRGVCAADIMRVGSASHLRLFVWHSFDCGLARPATFHLLSPNIFCSTFHEKVANFLLMMYLYRKNYYSEIIIILISQACNLFLCRLGLAISSGCALEEWPMAICACGLVTEHFIRAKCTLPIYIYIFF